MVIYKHTSKTSKKSYIGYTTKTAQERLKVHEYESNYGSQYAFHRAIRKYGIGDFDTEILEQHGNIEVIKNREKHWIKFYNTFSSNGYNMTDCGEGGPIRFGEENGFWKKDHTDEYKQVLSKRNKTNPPRIGTKTSEMGRKNMSEASIKKMKNVALRKQISEKLSSKIKYTIINPQQINKIIYGSKNFWEYMNKIKFPSKASILGKNIINVGKIDVKWKNGYSMDLINRINGWEIIKENVV